MDTSNLVDSGMERMEASVIFSWFGCEQGLPTWA